MKWLRPVACAPALLLAGCGVSVTPPTDSVEPRAGAEEVECVAMGGPGTVVTTSTGANCTGCAVVAPELAGDGDPQTGAVVTIGDNAGDGVALRVTKPGTVFPAGTTARMDLGPVRPRTFGPGTITLRTYLGGTLQEAGDVVETATAALTTSKDFDAVEAVIDGGSATAGGATWVMEVCTEAASVSEEEDPRLEPSPAAVIADLSTGANPYHEVYRRPDWTKHPSKVIPGCPADAPALELTFGPDLQANLEADAQKWQDMEPGVTYWIPGTNLLYVWTRELGPVSPVVSLFGPQQPYETANHGTLTAGVIADACRDCYLLVVADPEGGFTYSLDFIARNTPWVDVAASTQQAMPEDVQANAEFGVSLVVGPLSEYAAAAKRWAEAGKLYFIAAGNEPVQEPTNDRYLPPWFTIVSGAYAECRGHEFNSGKPTEFVSEYVAQAPAEDSVDGYQSVSGTSFSTPLVATRFAQALKIVRRELKDTREPGTYWSGKAQDSPFLADGKLTREDMYQAFVQAAELFATSEYTGPCGYRGVAVSPAPWLEMGWGYVGPDQALLAADLILGRREAPTKPAEQKQYMDAYMGAREATGSVTP